MGFVGLGYMTLIFAIKENNITAINLSFDGIYFQMISHGLISAGLFFCVGMLYERIHSRDLSNYGGLTALMPRLGLFFTFFALANAALPGTSGFVGEFLILLSTFKNFSLYAVIAALSLITGASYNLYLIKRLFYGPMRNKEGVHLFDLKAVEIFILGTLAAGVILLGVYPNLLTSFLPKDSFIALHQAFIS
jgi:NADH-quinone oxidoreductase subunit M